MKRNAVFDLIISELMIHLTTDITHWTMKIFNVLLQYT